MNDWHIAQINVAEALYDLDDPRIADFMAQLDAVNSLAEESPGFVWRLKDESGDATGIDVAGAPNLIVNMSVWQSAEDLFAFAYRSAHQKVMARRRQWFARPTQAYQALWWIERGRVPALEDGLERLETLRRLGPTAEAFSFKKRFPAPGGVGISEGLDPERHCVGWE